MLEYAAGVVAVPEGDYALGDVAQLHNLADSSAAAATGGAA